MTTETLMTCLGILETTYPSRFKGQDKKTLVAQWLMMFGDVDDRIFVMAVKNAIANCKFCPSFKEMTEFIKRAKMLELAPPLAALPEPVETRTEADREFMAEIMEWCGYTHEAAIATAWADVEVDT